jgi:arylformamidase
VPAAPRTQASITELIFVPNHVADGLYLLNLQFPKIMSDAAPSRPQLYSLHAV